ncbi:effector-associated domain EAD1-containing protein [Luteitalea sp.]
MYTLDGRQKKALHAALRHAFPRPAALERLVEFHLDEHLAVIAGEGALDDVIFRVIAWAEAHGRLAALVNGARAEVPGNPHVMAFERMVVEARDARPLDPALRQFAEGVRLAPALPDDPELEKRVFRAGFSDIAQWRARLGQAELAVCRVEAPPWRALGTGFLVGPDLVMTNRHVIEALAMQPEPSMVCRFDFKLSPDGSRLREGETFGLAHEWLVASSPVVDLDFAVLRLAEPAGERPTGGTADAPPRGWITPQCRDLEPDETIFVIQHPQGDTLKLATGRYDSREPTRLRYRVDTEPGSSGSPCFTAQMELVALHRGSAEGLANQGVPLDAIAAALPAGFFKPLPTARVAPAASPDAPTQVERLGAPRRRRSRMMAAVGVAVAAGLVAVPVWWAGSDPPARQGPPTPVTTPVPAAQAPAPAPPVRLRLPVREVAVPFAVTSGEADGCRSDAAHQRAFFRLETSGAWPAAEGARSREVQLVAIGDVEIEDASIAMRTGVEAAAVSLPQRHVARKWVFAEPVQAPVVLVACIRSTTSERPRPAFKVITWREVTP